MDMPFVTNLTHFTSFRHVHILGSFQNIKMARTAICNLILGNKRFLWHFFPLERWETEEFKPYLQSSFHIDTK